MATCSEGRLVRRKVERALLVMLAADANAAVAAAELAVNWSAVRCRRLMLVCQQPAIPSNPARALA